MNREFQAYFMPGSLTFFKPEVIADSDFGFPQMLNLEPTNDCNLGCVMCARRLAARPVTYLPWGVFSGLVDEMSDRGGVKWLALHKDGESLLHPDFLRMVRLIKQKKAARHAHLNTNALLLDEKMARGLIEAGLDSLTLSIDAFTPETYQKVKGGGDLATVTANAQRLIDLKRRLGADRPWVRAKIIDMPATHDEIEPFLRRWEGLADEVQVQKMHNYAGASVPPAAGADRHPCCLLWYSLAVNSDATVSTCCLDFRCRDLVGDLSVQTLGQIYTGNGLQAYRQAMLDGHVEQLASCRDCESWRSGPDVRDWLQSR